MGGASMSRAKQSKSAKDGTALPYRMHVKLPGGPGVHIHASLAGFRAVDISAQVMKYKEMMNGYAYTLNADGSVEVVSVADRERDNCQEYARMLSYWRGVEIAQEKLASVFGGHVASRLVNDLMGAAKFIGELPEKKSRRAHLFPPGLRGKLAKRMPDHFIQLCREAGFISGDTNHSLSNWCNLYICMCHVANYLRDNQRMNPGECAARIKEALNATRDDWEQIAKGWRQEAGRQQFISDSGRKIDPSAKWVQWAMPPGRGRPAGKPKA